MEYIYIYWFIHVNVYTLFFLFPLSPFLCSIYYVVHSIRRWTFDPTVKLIKMLTWGKGALNRWFSWISIDQIGLYRRLCHKYYPHHHHHQQHYYYQEHQRVGKNRKSQIIENWLKNKTNKHTYSTQRKKTEPLQR